MAVRIDPVTKYLKGFLKTTSPRAGTYYQAILQNLFFATLNREPEKRGFRDLNPNAWYDGGRGVTNLYRYQDLLADKDGFLKLLNAVPFVNGGLFDCLDDVPLKSEKRPSVRFDGFSDNPREAVILPNELFFGEDLHADLSEDYNDKRKTNVSVRPLIETLARYKFTVEESTPLEQEIALDPELLGKVFENLLASYNDETRNVARNKLGAFYTPRDVVTYMVDEALIAHFTAVSEPKLRDLLSDGTSNPCTDAETGALIDAIEKIRILDPACGSGAFPMGALNRLVHLLSKLDPNNVHWKERQLATAKRDLRNVKTIAEAENRESARAKCEGRIRDIEGSFDTANHDLDYARKLYLIEYSIFGVDIQPIACQIAKLRFFIALLADQKSEKNIRPLPNLETRIVAANTLLGEGLQLSLETPEVVALRERLREVRHEHFNARSPEQKKRSREKDAAIRAELLTVLSGHMSKASAVALANWDPFDQNKRADFFDPQWMFSLDWADDTGIFDIVIGNPPYVRQEKIKDQKPELKKAYECFSGTADLYVYFYERGVRLLKDGGIFSFITANKWMRSGYGQKLRKWLKLNTRVHRLVDFGDAEIFDAIAYPCIVLLQKSIASEKAAFTALNWQPEWKVEDVTRHLASDMIPMLQKDLAPDAWRIESKAKLALLDRIRNKGIPLGKYVNGQFYYGIKTGLNEAFVVDRETRDSLIAEHPSSADLLKPFLRGRDVKRWRVEFEDRYLIRIESSENVLHPWSGKAESKGERVFADTYPAIHAFMKPMRPEMVARSDQGKFFWELRSCSYWQEFEQPKIIYPDIYEHQSFAWDTHGFYGANTCYFIPNQAKWLIAILNSFTVEWFYSQTSNRIRGGYMRGFSDYMTNIPVPQGTADQQSLIERLAEAVIHLRGEGPAAAYFERLLNGFVYELFFPAELHAQKLHFFDLVAAARPPKAGPRTDLAGFHQQISDPDHPIYAALFALNGLEVVRIIEGRD